MRVCAVAILVSMLGVPTSAGQEPVRAVVAVAVTFTQKTSLKVSTDVLQFHVTDPARDALVVVEFDAGARTHADGEILMTVEPTGSGEHPGGPGSDETRMTFVGQGPGTLTGQLAPGAPRVAARWTGSGLRRGRLVFTLRAGSPGTYSIPVRFALATP